MKFFWLLTLAMIGGWLCGCAPFKTPYSSSETPHATAAISDDCTTASLGMGAIGEFTFVATHCRTADGATTGSVQIKGTKDTANNFLVGALSAAGGYLLHGLKP